MLVTVITPSRNQGKYIEDCLRSVHGQTHKEIEHIVLDCMSDDGTAALAARYPCTFLQGEDSGPAQAINRGLEMSKGEIVCWLNADDAFYSNTSLERAVQVFRFHPEVDLITGDGYFIDENGRYTEPIVMSRPGRLCLKWIKRVDPVFQPATFWRKNTVRLDENLKTCFDWKFWIDCFESGLNILYVPQYFALYRRHPDSITAMDRAARKRDIYSIVKHYNPNSALAAWCWLVWHGYRLSELLHMPSLKNLVRFANKAMDKLSDGFIVSG